MTLSKEQAIRIFGTRKALCAAMRLTNARISQWPDQLDQKTTDLVIGAAVRVGKAIPEGFSAPITDNDGGIAERIKTVDDAQNNPGGTSRKTREARMQQ
ncbi:hypothetical protein [Paraburkholderia elongata]|uniref:hypothetical protein n=1 Tax=Paraburkholderia elongata TaxID=2675747 RepID=UPI001C131C69|nr:hypothetical protein [Paraburkholderia elongata]